MKSQITTLALALMMMSGYSAIAHPNANDLQYDEGAPQTKMAPPMEMCKQMKAEMDQMKAHMKEMDAKLDRLVSVMDSSTGDAKVSAMSAVVKELVSQKNMMRMMHEKMDPKMMAHMMEHMKMPMKSGKMDCPMMKGTMGG